MAIGDLGEAITIRTRTGQSVRSRLWLLWFALIAPLALAATLLVWDVYSSGRVVVERQLSETARALALVIDRHIARHEAVLLTLASSPLIDRGDLAAFREQARAALRAGGEWIVLVDAGGRQLVDTRRPAGEPLPETTLPRSLLRAFETGTVQVSDLEAKPDGPAILSIDVPVLRSGRAAYVLRLMLSPAEIAQITRDQRLPDGWIGSVLDRQGTVIARNRDSERFLGRSATPDLLVKLGQADEAVIESVSLDGVSTLLAYSRAPRTGWPYVIAVPRQEVTATVQRSLIGLLLAGAGLAMIGMALSALAGRSLARAVDALALAASAIGQGRAVDVRPTGLHEADAVLAALSVASTELRRRESDMRQLNATLEARVAARTQQLEASNAELAYEIEERQRAEAALRASQQELAEREALYSSVFRVNTDGLFVIRVREDGRLLIETYNPAIETLLGVPLAQATGRPVGDIVPPELLLRLEPRIRECIAEGMPVVYEREFPSDAGGCVWLVTLVPIQDTAGRVVRVLGSNRDVTRERVAEEALRQSRDRYEALFEHSPLDLTVIDVAGDDRFVYEEANPSLAKALGIPAQAMIGRTPQELFPAEPAAFAQAKFEECVRTRKHIEYEISGQVPAGEVFRRTILVPLLDGDGRVGKLLATSIDLTEMRRMEKALRQSQKMEALGQLTGGIAHDFNNLLTVVMGNLDLLQRAKSERAPRLIENALQAAEQGRRLTQQLLAFGRRGALRPETFDPNARIVGMQDMLMQSLRGDIGLELDLADGVWPVEADPSQLQAALINLAANARDAMPKGGVFRIRTANATLPDDSAAEAVAIEISDTGVGISPEVLAHVFEPFFTTKEVGHGTGLGLAQVYGFVRQSGGFVQICSELSRGTTVRLLLPRAAALPAVAESIVPTCEPERPARILVVEDNPEVADLVSALLAERGHAVEQARNADDAIHGLERGRFDLVLSDLVMPGNMDGLDLARWVRQNRPDIPVLLATGYSEAAAKAMSEGYTLLSKPYRSDELAQALRRVLAGAANPAAANAAPLAPENSADSGNA